MTAGGGQRRREELLYGDRRVTCAHSRGDTKRGECIDSRSYVKQSRIGVDVHRQVERAVAHGGHGGAGAYASGGEVGSEGVAKGVKIDCSVSVIPLRDTRGCQIAVEDLDEIPRHVEQWGTGGQAHRQGVARLPRFDLEDGELGGEEFPQFRHEIISQRDRRPSASLLVLGQQFGVRSRSVHRKLPDGQAGQFSLPQASEHHHPVDQRPFLAEEFQLGQALGVVPEIPPPALGGVFEIVEGEIGLAPRLSASALGLGPVLALAAILRNGGGGQRSAAGRLPPRSGPGESGADRMSRRPGRASPAGWPLSDLSQRTSCRRS